jgi:hypothetical protein
MTMRTYRVYSSKKEIGRVLGLSEEDALKRAGDCWPKHKRVTVELYVKKAPARLNALNAQRRRTSNGT